MPRKKPVEAAETAAAVDDVFDTTPSPKKAKAKAKAKPAPAKKAAAAKKAAPAKKAKNGAAASQRGVRNGAFTGPRDEAMVKLKSLRPGTKVTTREAAERWDLPPWAFRVGAHRLAADKVGKVAHKDRITTYTR